jgi:hypothetical protein
VPSPDRLPHGLEGVAADGRGVNGGGILERPAE